MGSFVRICCAVCCLSLLAAEVMFAGPAPKKEIRESVRGYLVDTVCVKEEVAQLSELGPKHTKKCLQMPACRQGGYALLLPASNSVLRFDQHGNDLAIKLVDSRRLETGWLLRATGKRTGDEFAVATLELVTKPAVARKKR
jgi:hypothetical protein